MSDAASTGLVAFLFAVFCAYWAQTTHRSPWRWFACGLLLPPVAGLVLLWKNANGRPMPRHLEEHGRDDLLAVRKDVL